MNVISGLDKLIATAADEKPMHVVLDNNIHRDDRWDTKGYIVDKKGTLHLVYNDLDKRDDILRQLSSYGLKFNNNDYTHRIGAPTSEGNTGYCFVLLDSLIHARTHKNLKQLSHDYDRITDEKHSKEFTNEKMRLQKQLQEYMINNKINIIDYVKKFVVQPEKIRFGRRDEFGQEVETEGRVTKYVTDFGVTLTENNVKYFLGNNYEINMAEFAIIANASLRKIMTEKSNHSIEKYIFDKRLQVKREDEYRAQLAQNNNYPNNKF